MLPIDPFAQQIIRYYGCSVRVEDYQATIPRTNVYTSSGTHVGAGSISIPPEIQTAINARIFSPGGLVTPSCLTGNCSFSQPYSTVGFCGGCNDVTGDLRFKSTSSVNPSHDLIYDGSYLSYLPSSSNINSTGALPASLEGASAGETAWNVATMNSTNAGHMELIVARNPSLRDPTNQEQSDILDETCQSGNETWPCLGYGAASCPINVCVRTYEASISAGDFQETWILYSDGGIWNAAGSFDYQFDSGYYLAIIDTHCLTTFEKTSLAA